MQTNRIIARRGFLAGCASMFLLTGCHSNRPIYDMPDDSSFDSYVGDSLEGEESSDESNGSTPVRSDCVTFEQIVEGDYPYLITESPRLWAEMEPDLYDWVHYPKLRANIYDYDFTSQEDLDKRLPDDIIMLKLLSNSEEKPNIITIPTKQGARCWTDDANYSPWAVQVADTQRWTIGDLKDTYGGSWDNLWYDYYAFDSYDEVAGVSLEGLSANERMPAIVDALAAKGVWWQNDAWISDTKQDIVCGYYSGTKWIEDTKSFDTGLWVKDVGGRAVELEVIKTHEGLFQIDMSGLETGYYMLDDPKSGVLFYSSGSLFYNDGVLVYVDAPEGTRLPPIAASTNGDVNPNSTASGSADDYILPESSTRLYSIEELSQLSKSELELARNEIFARHGRDFSTDYIREYFEGKSWYVERYSPEYYDTYVNDLSAIEKENIDRIKSLE